MRYRLLSLILMLQVFVYSCSDSSTTILEDAMLLNHTELNISIGEKEVLTVTSAPSSNETLIWTSSDKEIASVFLGVVTAHKSGVATITATLGEDSASCTINVPERNYELVWSDEFDGTELNTENWTYEIGNGNWGWGNGEEQYYTNRPENIRVENGLLTIEARKEDFGGQPYTSARIITRGKKEFAYGKIEARLKVPSGRGSWPAFWMLGNGSWPRAGEIDIMEHVGYDPKTFHCALHTLNKNGGDGTNEHGKQVLTENAADDFHVITMEWVEKEFSGYDRIHVYVDGVKTASFGETSQLRASGDWPFNDDFFFILNMSVGGLWGGAEGIDDSMFDVPVLYQVDYVRVYQFQ